LKNPFFGINPIDGCNSGKDDIEVLKNKLSIEKQLFRVIIRNNHLNNLQLWPE